MLPDPAQDPVSPLLAMICNAACENGPALVKAAAGKVMDKVADAGAKAMETAVKAPQSQLGEHLSAPKGETVKESKEVMLAKGQDVTLTPGKIANVEAGLSHAGLDKVNGEERVAANDGHFKGAQGASVTLDQALTKQNIAATLDVQQQQIAI